MENPCKGQKRWQVKLKVRHKWTSWKADGMGTGALDLGRGAGRGWHASTKWGEREQGWGSNGEKLPGNIIPPHSLLSLPFPFLRFQTPHSACTNIKFSCGCGGSSSSNKLLHRGERRGSCIQSSQECWIS